MLSLRPLDAACHIDQRLRSTADPAVLVNLLTVAEADFPALKFAWQTNTNWMQQQPGFLSFVSALAAYPTPQAQSRSRTCSAGSPCPISAPPEFRRPGRTIMPKRVHLVAGILAPLCIAIFFLTTIITELFGSHAAVAALKSLIVTPGLWIMVPLLAAAGGSGMFLARSRKGRLVEVKKRRMPFIAANGLLVLVPCAIVLSRWAAAGSFDTSFYVVQALELIAGAINLTLMGLKCARRAAHDRAATQRSSSDHEGPLTRARDRARPKSRRPLLVKCNVDCGSMAGRRRTALTGESLRPS